MTSESRPHATTPDELPRFFGVPYIVSANMAVRPEAFSRVGGFDETPTASEDLAISFRLLELGYSIGFASAASIDYHLRVGLWPTLARHFTYGRGIAQVLARYHLPTGAKEAREGDHRRGIRRLGRLRPNSPMRTDLTPYGLARRAALAGGRTVGTIEEVVLARRSRHRRAWSRT